MPHIGECSAGGLGGLGLLFARWAVSQNAASLTLLDTAALSLPRDLCAAGTAVTVAASNVALQSTASLLGDAKIDGVLHASGVLRDALLLKQTASNFREVLAGKASLSSLQASSPS